VGNDDFGQRLMNQLTQHHVRTEYLTVSEGTSSGCAMVMVDRKGENSIVVAPGANAKVSPADVDAAAKLIATASVVVMQLEIPLATVKHAIAMCQRFGVRTILDPAPVPPKGLPRSLFGVDVFSPNEHEAQALLEISPRPRIRRKRATEPKQMAGDLLSQGAKSIALKLGARGSMYVSRSGGFYTAKPFKVKVVDTTAAGDAFTGALAVAQSEAMPIEDAMRFANAAGAIATTGFGAQPALPSRAAVDRLMRGS
jgi:ribokinase